DLHLDQILRVERVVAELPVSPDQLWLDPENLELDKVFRGQAPELGTDRGHVADEPRVDAEDAEFDQPGGLPQPVAGGGDFTDIISGDAVDAHRHHVVDVGLFITVTAK